MSNQLEAGDVVSLKGQRMSPSMTVISVFTDSDDDQPYAKVAWFDGQRRNQTDCYPVAVLTRVKE